MHKIYPANEGVRGRKLVPLLHDFFGDELESSSEIDLDTKGSERKVDAAKIAAA